MVWIEKRTLYLIQYKDIRRVDKGKMSVGLTNSPLYFIRTTSFVKRIIKQRQRVLSFIQVKRIPLIRDGGPETKRP